VYDDDDDHGGGGGKEGGRSGGRGGAAVGLLYDAAQDMVVRAIPPLTKEVSTVEEE